jgi:hypothetical protein
MFRYQKREKFYWAAGLHATRYALEEKKKVL